MSVKEKPKGESGGMVEKRRSNGPKQISCQTKGGIYSLFFIICLGVVTDAHQQICSWQACVSEMVLNDA